MFLLIFCSWLGLCGMGEYTEVRSTICTCKTFSMKDELLHLC